MQTIHVTEKESYLDWIFWCSIEFTRCCKVCEVCVGKDWFSLCVTRFGLQLLYFLGEGQGRKNVVFPYVLQSLGYKMLYSLRRYKV